MDLPSAFSFHLSSIRCVLNSEIARVAEGGSENPKHLPGLFRRDVGLFFFLTSPIGALRPVGLFSHLENH